MSVPWDPGYKPPGIDTDLVKQIEGQIEGAVNTAVVAGTGILDDVVGSGASVGVSAPGSAVPPTGAVAQDISAVIEAAAQGAIRQAQGQVVAKVQDAITGALSSLGEPQVATIPAKDLKKVDAWERAGRTFLVGLFVTVMAGLVQVIGQASTTGVNFFTKDGWTAVGVLAVGSIVNSACSYILRYVREPAGATIDSGTKPAANT